MLRTDIDPVWWAAQMAAERTTIEIAEELGVSTMSVYRAARRAGLAMPERSFASVVEKSTFRDGECLRWTGSTNGQGYPSTSIGGEARLSVRRELWERAHGVLANGDVVYRIAECPHPDCVALQHLQVATVQEHARERADRGVYPRGQQHWNAKLTTRQARAILRSDKSAATLAQRYGVSLATIYAIRNGRRWAHLSR